MPYFEWRIWMLKSWNKFGTHFFLCEHNQGQRILWLRRGIMIELSVYILLRWNTKKSFFIFFSKKKCYFSRTTSFSVRYAYLNRFSSELQTLNGKWLWCVLLPKNTTMTWFNVHNGIGMSTSSGTVQRMTYKLIKLVH